MSKKVAIAIIIIGILGFYLGYQLGVQASNNNVVLPAQSSEIQRLNANRLSIAR